MRGVRTTLVVTLLIASLAGACSNDEAANDAVREAIEDNDVDPSSELTYEHYLYFDDEAGARAAERDLIAGGFEVATLPTEGEIVDWALLASKVDSLDSDELDAVTRSMEDLATKHGGTYDGWGTALGG